MWKSKIKDSKTERVRVYVDSMSTEKKGIKLSRWDIHVYVIPQDEYNCFANIQKWLIQNDFHFQKSGKPDEIRLFEISDSFSQGLMVLYLLLC